MTDDTDHPDEEQSPHGGKIHPFAPRAGENTGDQRETPFTPCSPRVSTDDADATDDVDVDLPDIGSGDTRRRDRFGAALLPVGVVLAALQTPLAVSVLGLALVAIGGVAAEQAFAA